MVVLVVVRMPHHAVPWGLCHTLGSSIVCLLDLCQQRSMIPLHKRHLLLHGSIHLGVCTSDSVAR
jgi:hypothetical protein